VRHLRLGLVQLLKLQLVLVNIVSLGFGTVLIHLNMRKVFVPHRKHYVSATKPSRLMLFREIIAVYCENHMEDTNILCGQNAEF
jgi:hypothetical protein